jgi:hypothetical protein
MISAIVFVCFEVLLSNGPMYLLKIFEINYLDREFMLELNVILYR